MSSKKKQIVLSDLPEGSIANIKGKPFPQFKGLLPLAHQNGLQSMSSDLIMFENGIAVIKSKVTGDRGEFEAHGDASKQNVPQGADHEIIRRAETRSFSRCLRLYLGIGDCAADELAPDAMESAQNDAQGTSTNHSSGQSKDGRKRGQTQTQTNLKTSSPTNKASSESFSCPACGGRVYDNRSTAQGKQPLWRCGAGASCPGGKGDFAWASWDPDFFETHTEPSLLDDVVQGIAEVFTSENSVASTIRQDDDEGPPPFDDSDIPF